MWEITWTPEAEAHIARHGITPPEVNQALAGRIATRRVRGGLRLVLGRGEAGRYLTIVLRPVSGPRAKLVTAREMSPSERRLYRRRKP